MDLGLWGVGLGIGLVVIGGGYGIGRLAAAALESIARQPEATGNIRGTAIILAALIEGFTFFALIVALLAVNAAPGIASTIAAGNKAEATPPAVTAPANPGH